MKRVLGYSRVSKREQAEGSHALEQQINRLLKAGATEIYTDIQSGTRDDRRQFNLVMELVRTRLVDEVIVTRIDRLGRSLLSARRCLDQFRASGVKLTILDGEIDLSTVAGRTHANMMAVFAEMESEMISERSKHGWEYLRQRQVAIHPPFGYIKVGDRHELDRLPFLCLLETLEELSRAALARDAIEIFFEVKSLRKTIQQVNQKYGIQRSNHAGPKTGFKSAGLFGWSPSGFKLWITSEVLRGNLAYLRSRSKPVIIYDTHKEHRLISDAEAREIEAILSHNRDRRGWGMKALKYPLSGLIFCELCGGAFYVMVAGKRNGKNRTYGYYQCKNYQHRACPAKKTIRMEALESAVIDALISRASAIAEYAQTPPEYTEPAELVELKQQLADLERMRFNPAIETAKTELRAQIQAMVVETQQSIQIDTSKKELLNSVFSDKWYWEGLLNDEKRQIYRALIKRVVVRDGAVVDVELLI